MSQSYIYMQHKTESCFPQHKPLLAFCRSLFLRCFSVNFELHGIGAWPMWVRKGWKTVALPKADRLIAPAAAVERDEEVQDEAG